MQKYFKSALHCVDMPSSKEQPFSHKRCESFFNKYSGKKHSTMYFLKKFPYVDKHIVSDWRISLLKTEVFL